MKKKWLQGINMLLGALSVSLLGCKSTHECLYGPPPEPEKYGCPEELVRPMYGVPDITEQADTVIYHFCEDDTAVIYDANVNCYYELGIDIDRQENNLALTGVTTPNHGCTPDLYDGTLTVEYEYTFL